MEPASGPPAPGPDTPRPRALLVAGSPGVGKTTLVRAVAGALRGRRLRGFYTEEIREGRERRGFRLVTFDGREAVMAHVDFPGPRRVGKYGVDAGVIDELAGTALAPDPTVELYLVDEIGKMECFSERFVTALRALLEGNAVLLATVAARGGGFIAEVKGREDAELWTVTRGNRSELAGRLLGRVREILGAYPRARPSQD